MSERPRPPRQRATARGFTLMELMVTIAIVGILAMLAAPSFVDYRRNAALASATASLVGALATARSEALKRNADVLVAPVAGEDWSGGWRVFVDADMNRAHGEADITLLTAAGPASEFLAVASNVKGPVGYSGAGFAISFRTLEVRRTDVADTQFSAIRRITISSSGRVRVWTPAKPNDDGGEGG